MSIKKLTTLFNSLSVSAQADVLAYAQRLAGKEKPVELPPAPVASKGKPGRPKSQSKNGTYTEIRIVRNRPLSKGGKEYRYECQVTYQDGKEIEREYIRRVG